MKTDELIALLAKDSATPAPSTAPGRVLALPLLIGAAASLVLIAAWLGLQSLEWAIQQKTWWLKAGYAAGLGLAGLGLVARLSRPVARGTGAYFRPLLVLIAIMVAIGAMKIAQSPAEGRLPLLLGKSWTLCAPLIVVVSSPIFAATVFALRRLAPTRLAEAGAAAGLLAGGMGAALYALHCPEIAPSFVAVWYTLGVAIWVGLGALLGPRLLRW